MKQLIGQWMGGLLGGDGQDRMDRGDSDDSPLVTIDGQSLVGGLSRFLAEILAKLETSYGGAPLDVEISYEMDDDVSPCHCLVMSSLLDLQTAADLAALLHVSMLWLFQQVWQSGNDAKTHGTPMPSLYTKLVLQRATFFCEYLI